MQLTISVIGLPKWKGGGKTVVEDVSTLSELWERQVPEDAGTDLHAFVNGEQVEKDWSEVELQDGDDILFMVPVSGG